MFPVIVPDQNVKHDVKVEVLRLPILRGDPRTALQYIDQALVIRPDYSDALRDRQIALEMLKAQSTSAGQ